AWISPRLPLRHPRKTTKMNCLKICRMQKQQGVAAIEFALTLTVLLMIFFGIVTFGALFWMQQKASSLAAEGARVALVKSIQGEEHPAQEGCLHVIALAQKDLLLQSLASDSVFCSSEPNAASPRYATIIVTINTV